MKIEKISDNQIKCTLSKEDLATRQIRVSELAYGSEKTQGLFREMLREADYEYGFEANNTPLMIEAIPVSSEGIVLIITKVDDPEELDTRFSRFAPSFGKSEGESDYDDDDEDGDDLLRMIAGDRSAYNESPKVSFDEILQKALQDESADATFIFEMKSLGDVMSLAAVAGDYKGCSSLYKKNDSCYILALKRGDCSIEAFKAFCRTASEFGRGRVSEKGGDEYLKEHAEVLIPDRALSKLSAE